MAEEKHGVHLVYIITYGYHGNPTMQVQKIWEDSGASWVSQAREHLAHSASHAPAEESSLSSSTLFPSSISSGVCISCLLWWLLHPAHSAQRCCAHSSELCLEWWTAPLSLGPVGKIAGQIQTGLTYVRLILLTCTMDLGTVSWQESDSADASFRKLLYLPHGFFFFFLFLCETP